MPFVYIVKCSDNIYYTGSTFSTGKRFWEKKDPKSSVKNKHRLEFVYIEEWFSIPDCLMREQEIQKWSREKKEAIVNSDFKTLIENSKRKK